jgi:hypothetical protein
MKIERMLQLSLGVPDAVAENFRMQMAERLLLNTKTEDGLVVDARLNELVPVAREIIDSLVKVYVDGGFNETLCGLPVRAPRYTNAVGPVAAILQIATPSNFVDLGADKYQALATVAVDAFVKWAQDNPNFSVIS